MNLNPSDAQTLKLMGISPELLQAQIDRFVTGFPYLTIIDTAHTNGGGIMQLSDDRRAHAIERWDKFLSDGGEVYKFVPASGAASRMFKALFEYLDGPDSTLRPDSPVDKFIAGLHDFAFYPALNAASIKLYDADIDTLTAAGRYKEIVAALLSAEGLNYGNLPKGLLQFHSYAEGPRTPLEEHLVEGAQTAANSQGVVNLHFTVSPEHRALFQAQIDNALPSLEAKFGVKYNISLSEQKKSTDTVAVNPDNTPFREADGALLFRPAGHGALIQNLNDIDSSVVFIKNIDNVVPDTKRAATVEYKKVIAGTLMLAHDTIEHYLNILNAGTYTADNLAEMIGFLNNTLHINDPKLAQLNPSELATYLQHKFNRPLRVCGMVRNEGEPGGGPYITVNPDGSSSPQILESTQIDLSVDNYKSMMARATHFNPVDLVCFIKDIDGNKYDLPAHVDYATGFISSKSKNGRELRALELPGLWNGAMSDWNTIFVEVPIDTFNPVKTVNDLLRPAHQS